MKKVLYFAALLFCAGLASCEKDEIGGTATESMAGDWYVTVDCIDKAGNVAIEDFNEGRFHVLTYNSAENVGNKLYVDDLYNLLGMKALAICDQNAMTFATPDTVDNISAHSKYVSDRVIVTNGKIIKNGGRQNNGSVADSISFYFEYTEDAYADAYEYKKYHIHGVRYSGLEEND